MQYFQNIKQEHGGLGNIFFTFLFDGAKDCIFQTWRYSRYFEENCRKKYLLAYILNTQPLSQQISVQNETSICLRIPSSRCRSRYVQYSQRHESIFLYTAAIYSVFIIIRDSTFRFSYLRNYHIFSHIITHFKWPFTSFVPLVSNCDLVTLPVEPLVTYGWVPWLVYLLTILKDWC